MTHFSSGLSLNPDAAVALDEALSDSAEDADLAVLFVSHHHLRRVPELVRQLRGSLPGSVVVGCTAAGVIGADREVEDSASLSILTGSLPGITLTPFCVDPSGGAPSVEAWRDHLGAAPRGCLLLSDPYSVDLQQVLAPLGEALGGAPLVGGQASGGRRAGTHALFAGEEIAWGGLVGLGISGPIQIETRVAQGCRPIGAPMFVTACEGNRILSLDGRPPIEALREVYTGLSPVDQALFHSALSIGVQMRDQREYHPGDFLIRNILGVPRDQRGLAVAYKPERFGIVQLHLRDAEAARADLEAVLRIEGPSPAATLLFTCVGRGEGLFGEPDHDSTAFRERFGDVPLCGLFCNGEVGPVQGVPYVHGYTSIFASFHDVA
ncbi:MAG TPA: hypothetical protein ENK18_24840 [Deltaproteobacteria bacterium]|nr:hypothetical protein [Deltaproteobacteria bacterium]